MTIQVDIKEQWYIKFCQQKSSVNLKSIDMHQFINRNEASRKLMEYHISGGSEIKKD